MHWKRVGLVAVVAAAMGVTACKGDKGDTGTAGTAGAAGTPGVSTGTISGTLTYSPAGTAIPASGVSVNVVPDVGLTPAVTAADGTYLLASVPIGTYSVVFSGNAFASARVDGIVVAATKTVVVDKVLAATNPLVLTAPVASAPAGFGAQAQLGVTATGGTAPYTYAWTPSAANPTAVTLSSATAQNPTFTTGTLAAVIAGGKVTGLDNYLARTVPGFVSVSTQQLNQMTYNFTCLVKDAQGFSKSVTVAVPPATLAQGSGIVPIGQIVILNVPGNAAPLAFTAQPAGSTAVLNEASGQNPWFIPDAAGDYAVAGLSVNAGSFLSASPTCGGCHSIVPTVQANVAAKWQAWNNSAHGNHFFKYMHYDAGGALVWNTDATGNPVPAPTADATIFWNQPGAMTTFEFGMTGGEGSHYSQSCIGCHTTGYNLLAANGGFDDAAAAASWSFPNLATVLGGTAVTPAPVMTAWNAIPASVVKFAGMQCESCHGPLGNHITTAGVVKPTGEYDVGSCAVCHDRPSNHDRVYLWKQSLHSDLTLAEEEAVVESRGTSTSCYRCHAAQGFVAYLANKDADPTQIVRPAGLLPAPATCTPVPQPGGDLDPSCPCTPASGATTCTGDPAFYAYLKSLGLDRAHVQPQTCAACHDAHSTSIRVDGNTGPLANGWQMNGAGAGALCMVCHNTRNGARGDYVTLSGSIGGPHAPVQTDLLMGQNAFFMGAGGQLSRHAAVADTCVGCHMTLHPDSVKPTNTNHTFTADDTICKNCHGDNVNLEGLKGQFLVARGNLEKALATAFTAAVGGATPSYYLLVPNPTPGATPAYAVANLTVAPTSIVPSGRTQNLALTFPTTVQDGFGNGVTALTVNYKGVSLSSATNAAVTAFTTPLFATQGIIAKANWNYWLVSSVTTDPGANVVHNPSFVFSVLSNTTGALLGSGGAGL